MTIEELAAQVGMTVRNVRAYNSAGLLSPPTLRGRLGLYGEEHLAQLRVVRSLRNQGISLERIKALIKSDKSMGHSLSWTRLSDLARTLSWHISGDGIPQRQRIEDIESIWHQHFTPEMAELMERSGLQRVLPDGTVEHYSPGVRPVALRMAALGLHLEQALEIQASLSRDLRQAVRGYLRVLLSCITTNEIDSTKAPDDLALLSEAPELLTLAVQAMLPILLQQETQRLGTPANGNTPPMELPAA